MTTLVVGNLVAGGTGKTPVVVEVARTLANHGARPGIVTRGYGGRAKTWPRLVTSISDPLLCGDEAVELAQTTGFPVVAGPDRPAAIRWLQEYLNCDVAVSDDGLQHYAMRRDLELVLVDGERKFGNGRRLPVGPLREPPARLQQSDLVMVTGRAARPAPQQAVVSELQATVSDAVPVLSCSLLPVSARLLFGESAVAVEDAPFVGQACVALCGIGSPGRFHADLRDLGCDLVEETFADHHSYGDMALSGALEKLSKDRWVVTTAKDAVKLRSVLLHSGVADEPDGLNQSWVNRVWVLERALMLTEEDSMRLDTLLSTFVLKNRLSGV